MSGNSNNSAANMIVWAIFVMAAIWAMVVGNQFGIIHLQDFDVNKITTLLGSIFAIALFFERCIEVVVAIFRNKTAELLKNELDKPHHNKDAETNLTNYRLETQSISLRIGFVVGIVVSAAGIRILGELVTIPSYISQPQQNFFHLVDIFITAGVLAGGSDGIHQIMTVYDDYMKYFSKTALNKTETETADAKAKQAEAKKKAGNP